MNIYEYLDDSLINDNRNLSHVEMHGGDIGRVVASCATRLIEAMELGTSTHVAQARGQLKTAVLLLGRSRILPQRKDGG